MSLVDDAHSYSEYFAVVSANTPSLLYQAYRLRYQVYCVENGFEPRPENDIETDGYDTRSVHAVLIYRPTGQVCGCVRLILPAPDSALPIHRTLNDASRNAFQKYPEAATAEVSRYAVSKTFRRRLGETHTPDVHYFELGAHEHRRMIPHLTLGLMIATARLSVRHRMTHVCATMAPALRRLLSAFGMEFLSLGPAIECHGGRQPCIAALADLLAGVERRHPAYFDQISREFRDGCELRDGLEPTGVR